MSNPVKPLPDCPGWWLREGADQPVHVAAYSSDCDGLSLRATIAPGLCPTSELKPGRWLKVELPTFPPREKAPFRLCWGTTSYGRKLFTYHAGTGSHEFRDQVGRWHCLPDDIVWLTPEYLDELGDPPATVANGR